VVALSVLVVAASIFCQTLLSTTRMRAMNRENTLAADAARVVLERMRNEPFLQIYRKYNEYPGDDPGGAGTAPGHLFEVDGLQPLEGAPAGRPGRITFPSMLVEVVVQAGGKGGMQLGGSGELQTTTEWHLREDYDDEALGMPRDLNGDNVIDSVNHKFDYLVLPVRVRIEWRGTTGARKFEIVTQLGDFPFKEGL
jgi:hypothetical protein